MKQFFKGLGVGLGCLVCFVLGVVFNTQFLGFANSKQTFINNPSLHINEEIKASNSLKAGMFESSINFFSNDARLKQNDLDLAFKESLTKEIQEITQKLQASKICSGGSIEIKPSFAYNKGVKSQEGWGIDASFACKFKDKNEFDVLLKSLNLKAISMSTSPVINAISTQEKAAQIKILKDKILANALDEAKMLSKTLNKACVLENIDYNSYVPVLYKANSPVGEEVGLHLGARVGFRCE